MSEKKAGEVIPIAAHPEFKPVEGKPLVIEEEDRPEALELWKGLDKEVRELEVDLAFLESVLADDRLLGEHAQAIKRAAEKLRKSEGLKMRVLRVLAGRRMGMLEKTPTYKPLTDEQEDAIKKDRDEMRESLAPKKKGRDALERALFKPEELQKIEKVRQEAWETRSKLGQPTLEAPDAVSRKILHVLGLPAEPAKKLEAPKVEEHKEEVTEKRRRVTEPEIFIEPIQIVEREREALSKFFGFDVVVPPLPKEVMPERIKEWAEKGFEMHYLPWIEMKKDANFPGWKKPIHDLFYYFIEQGQVSPDAIKLPGAWVLIDARSKPKYQERGQQMYEPNDIVGDVLAKLRDQKVIHRDESLSMHSRFGISHQELSEPDVRQALSEALGVKANQLRLPRAIEWGVLANLYHPEWGTEGTLEWFDDRNFKNGEQYRGGDRSLKQFSGGSPDDHENNIGFRPIVIFNE